MKCKWMLFAVLVMVVSFGMLNTSWAAEKQTVFKWATYIPKNDVDPQSATLQWFADEFEKRTNGRYAIKIFWSGTLAKVKEIPWAVRDGLADMGDLVTPYFPDHFPINNVGCFVVPMGLTTDELGKTYFYLHEKYPAFKKEFADQNLIAIGFRPLESYGFLTREPHHSLSELKGSKIRSFGKAWPAFIKAAGGTPVSVATPEMYEALERGVLNSTPIGITLANRWKVDQVAKYFMGPFTPIMGHCLLMNLKTHEELPQDVKAILDGLGQEYLVQWLKTLELQVDEVKQIWKKKGVEILPIDRSEIKKIIQSDLVKAVHNDWIERAKAKGLKNPEEIIEIFMPK
ncbi:MAG: TRAP transporter substrate-binding protein DctP [Desulfobacteraceae bacterium]